MAQSTCPKCESHRFELKLNEPSGSAYKFYFIQCASCGAVVGTTDYYNTGALLEKIGSGDRRDLHR